MIHRSRSRDRPQSLPASRPAFMSRDQVGQQSFIIVAVAVASSSQGRSFDQPSPPESTSAPVSMSDRLSKPNTSFTASYLTDLRSNKPARPIGSRPLPATQRWNSVNKASEPAVHPLRTTSTALRESDPVARSSSTNSHRPTQQRAAHGYERAHSALGRPVARPPPDDPSVIHPSRVYLERGQRWMEKQEARSLTDALNDMDLNREAEIHANAQKEASELVWSHKNSVEAEAEKKRPYSYRDHLRKGSHARAQSAERSASLQVCGSMSSKTSSRASSGTHSGQSDQMDNITPAALKIQRPKQVSEPRVHQLWDSPEKKAYMSLAQPSIQGATQHSVPRPRNVSGGSLFRNPEDQIYEEPEEMQEQILAAGPVPAPLRTKVKSMRETFQPSHQAPNRSNTDSAMMRQRVSQFEIHRNPPSQSRNPNYTTNHGAPRIDLHLEEADPIPTKNGLEVRSKDIAEATSMRLRDRSPKLPTPAMVSDVPGRPIVSFDPNWRPRDTLKERKTSNGSPQYNSAPKINLPSNVPKSDTNSFGKDNSNVPTISVMQVPSISISELPSTIVKSEDRPLPNPTAPTAAKPFHPKPIQAPSSTSHRTSLPHYTLSSARRPTASCAQCQLPIAGRVVTAADSRFHPECFICYHCGEALECVAFFPEPEAQREERVARIRARHAGETLPEDVAGQSMADDGDEGPRFFCHLDFHELFSPRCRSCKTPIEGEVVIACGGEWHVGHFFCAECGDPFEPTTPFVEKDGYAWCISCHTNRYSTRCKKCRKPVTDTVVKALGAEWHADCFCCFECGGHFDDGRYFLRCDDVTGVEESPVCVACEERRLKA